MMKKILTSLLAVFLFGCAHTSTDVMVGEYNSTKIRLFKTECSVPKIQKDIAVLTEIAPVLKGQWYSGNVLHQGTLYRACWVSVPDEKIIFIIDESGDAGAVPITNFRPDEGV